MDTVSVSFGVGSESIVLVLFKLISYLYQIHILNEHYIEGSYFYRLQYECSGLDSR
jgi:hypothetical protein